jgi:isocitrate dehydrogenase (NAD+)
MKMVVLMFCKIWLQNLANPTAILLSSVMMLQHLKMTEPANHIHKSILKTIAEGKYRTGDLGGFATCTDYTKALIDNLGQ